MRHLPYACACASGDRAACGLGLSEARGGGAQDTRGKDLRVGG